MKQIFTVRTVKYFPYVLSVLFLVLYISTLSPTISFIDSGELATVCCTMGIAHPTGYPLFTLIGHLFSKAPLFGSEIYTLNLMCALFCAMGLFFFYKLNFLLHGNDVNESEKSKKKKNNGKYSNASGLNIKIIAVVSSVLSLGLSHNYWMQSTSIEVYPLHILLIVLLIYLFLKNFEIPVFENDKIRADGLRGWLVFSFILGLSFTNHMSTIFLIPAFAFMYFYEYKFKPLPLKLLGIMIIPFLLGLSLYLYLPFRAAAGPSINWGDPSTFETFKWHISGKQYSIWVFSSLAEMKEQANYFFRVVPEDYLYLSVLVSIMGIIYLLKNNRKYFYFTIILFFTCFMLAINYSIVDIDSYFLLCYVVISIWVGFGILWLYSVFAENGKKIKPGFLLFFLIIPLIELFNYSKTDESINYLVEDYTMNIFNSTAKNGIVISYQWDNWVSAAYYYQHVKGIRKDIVVIDKELSRRSWYLKQLETNYPALIKKSRKEVDAFLHEVYKFEHDLPYDGMVIEEKFVGMLNSFIENNIGSVPVYVTNEIEKEIGAGYKRIPDGLVYRLNKEAEYLEPQAADIKFRPYKKGRYPDMLMNFYGIMLTNRASYEGYFNHRDRAYSVLNKLQTIYPDYGPAISLKRILNGSDSGF